MIITRLPVPEQAEIISIDEIKEFCRIDEELDAVCSSTLSILCNAAIETGEQETGIIWRAADYEIEHLSRQGPRRSNIILPITPVFELDSLVLIGEDGVGIEVDDTEYIFRPSDLENRRPWAVISPVNQWRTLASSFNVKLKAGWTATSLPRALKSWALNRIASANEFRTDMQPSTRETISAMPRNHVERLLDRYRVMGGPGYG